MFRRNFALAVSLTVLAFCLVLPYRAMGAIEASPGQVNAREAVLLEVSTGTILFEQNADQPIEPASFTKVMTLYLVFEALRQGIVHLNDEVYISQEAWRTGGSKMFVGVGTKIPLEELIKGIAVESGNDACIAIAEHLAGSTDAFVDAMNKKAKDLGMTNTHFVNPDGLPADGQVTTARDMATLDMSYVRQFPEALRYHSMQEFTYNSITQRNRNRLLFRDPTVDGLKTGFVSAAGYHLSATAKRDDMRLLAVVMGAASPAIREREAAKLLNFGFRYYTLVKPFPENQPIATAKVWEGLTDALPLYPREAPDFLIAQAQKKSLRWEVQAPKEVTAPIKSQQAFGEVVFLVNDQPTKSVKLVSHEDIGRAGWAKRAWQTILQINKFNWSRIGMVAGGIILIIVLGFVLANRRSSVRSRSRYP
jgi:D-alanyl-D-alanine carboxypeptidase (penicillin-binding protein 5/6)